MTFAVIVLILVVIVQAICLGFSIRKNFESDERIDELTDSFRDLDVQIDESLEIIDDCYGRVAKALKTPLMSDEPEVRELASDLKHIKGAILTVANKLNTLDVGTNEEETEDAA